MRYSIVPWCMGVLGLLGTKASADVTIDATALTTPTFRVYSPSTGYLGPFSSSTVHTLALPSDSYAFVDAISNLFVFDVDLGGNVIYSGVDEAFLDGSGTADLVVRGFDFSVDASALTSTLVRLLGLTAPQDSNLLLAATGIPGQYPLYEIISNGVLFLLDSSGLIQYPAGYEDFLDGAGSTQLVVTGFAFTVDAQSLSSPTFRISPLTPYASSAVTLSVVGIPGVYPFYDELGNSLFFSLDEDGGIVYDPAWEGFLDGAGSDHLEVDGYHLTVDARGYATTSHLFWLEHLLGGVSTSELYCIVGIPGASYIFRDIFSNYLFFQVDNDGNLQTLPPVYNGQPVNGNGSPNLLIGLNTMPLADAGDNQVILSRDQNTTLLMGMTSDFDCDYLVFRWYQETVDGDLLVAGPYYTLNGEAPLDLATLGSLTIGEHTFRLEVADPFGMATDAVIVTVENSPPVGVPGGAGVYAIGPANDITLSATIADHDGDVVTYDWKKGAVVLFHGSIASIAGGDPVVIPDHLLATTLLGVGNHTLDLVLFDGVNTTTTSLLVTVTGSVDTTQPTLAPVASPALLWPPNHKMVPVTILANASDDSGPVTLSVTVVSSEPPDFDGDGHTIPDTEIVSVDSTSGVIALRLRSERAGKGDGRTYTVTITATDGSGNSASAVVTIKAPHNKKG